MSKQLKHTGKVKERSPYHYWADLYTKKRRSLCLSHPLKILVGNSRCSHQRQKE
ncbi:MAG TPA: hypothetical protein V6D35_12090 [Candidatus Sericytochromatia bacterium]